jgi:hypothetical protein
MVLACTAASLAGLATGSVATEQISSPSRPPVVVTATPNTADIGARTRDPERGPDWAVRTYASVGGDPCVEVGRTDGGNFGRANGRGEIEHQPAQQQGTCAARSQAPMQVVISRYAAPERTVVFGQAAQGVARITVAHNGRAVEVPLGERGTFLLVMRSVLAPEELPVTAYLSDGSTYAEDWR